MPSEEISNRGAQQYGGGEEQKEGLQPEKELELCQAGKRMKQVSKKEE